MVKISVLIPSYNHEKYIEKAINSVLEQTFEDFEILIGDDCSKDNSREVINKFHDSRIKKYFYKENVGGSENLNRLIDLSSGEYIAILNSDDYWEKEKLEKQYLFMENNLEYGACFTWVQYIDRDGNKFYPKENVFIKENRTQSEWLYYFLVVGNCLCHPSILIRRKIYDEIGKYPKFMRQIPDFYEWIKLVKKYPIYIMPEELVNFRWFESDENTSGFSISNTNRTYYEFHYVVDNFFNDCNFSFFDKEFNFSSKCKNCPELLEFEENMLLFKKSIFGNIGKLIAYQRIGELLEKNEIFEKIVDNYDFTINDFHEMGADLNFHPVDIVEYKVVENVPSYITCSRIFKLLMVFYNSRFYNFLLRLKKVKKFRDC